MQRSISLKYEPASGPLQISVKQPSLSCQPDSTKRCHTVSADRTTDENNLEEMSMWGASALKGAKQSGESSPPAIPPPPSCFRLSASGFRVSGFGIRVSGFGFRVMVFGLQVSGFGFRVSGFGFRVSGFGLRISVLGFRVSGSG